MSGRARHAGAGGFNGGAGGDLAVLEHRVAAALQGLDAEPVNVAALAARTRAAIAADRRRRVWWRAGIGAVAVPVAVTLGLTGPFAAAPGGGGTAVSPVPRPAPTASSAPVEPRPTPTSKAGPEPSTSAGTKGPATASTASPSRSRTSRPSVASEPDGGPDAQRFEIVPWEVAAQSLDRNQVAYRIPDAVNLTTDEVTGPAEPQGKAPDYAGHPVVPGQTCRADTVLPRPVAGKLFSWLQEEYRVDVHVAGWAPGTAAQRFAETKRNDGRCSFGDVEMVPLGLEGMGHAEQEYAAALTTDSVPGTAFAIGRVGDVTVAVQVWSFTPPDDPAQQRDGAGSLARGFLEVVAERVKTTGLAATAATGGAGR